MLGGAACEDPRALRSERAAGPTGREDPFALSPLQSGRALLSAAFLPRGRDEPARGKGLSGPWPPPRSPVEPNVFKHTHKNLHGGFVTRARPDSGHPWTQAQSGRRSKKKIDLVASSLPRRLGRFPVSSASPRTPGLPRSWGPRDSGLWFGKLADEVFVCLFVTERREVGGRSSGKGKFNHLFWLSVRRLVGIRRVGPGRAWGIEHSRST